MKKKIAIIGSTGSIGTSLLDLVDTKKNDLILLTANKNYKKEIRLCDVIYHWN